MEGKHQTRRAIVVGGGIGGLATGLALHRSGWNIVILERAPEFGKVGAGLPLMANALRALEFLGLGEAISKAGHVNPAGCLRTPRGRWLIRVHDSEMDRQLGTSALGIHRATLHPHPARSTSSSFAAQRRRRG